MAFLPRCFSRVGVFYRPIGSGKDFIMETTKTKATKLRALCESAIFIALATVLGLLKFPPFYFSLWGNGGSIDFVMLPLLLLAFRRGAGWAIPSGLAYGFVRCLIGGGIGYGVLSVLLDYVLAYGMVGVAGFFKGGKNGVIVGTVVATVARFFVHFLSGITIWKIALGDSYEIFGMAFDSSASVAYSLLYNGSFMLGEMLFCLALMIIFKKPFEKLINS